MIDIDRMLRDLDPETTTNPEVALVATLQAKPFEWPYLLTAREASSRLASLGVRYPPRNDMSFAETLTDLAPMILRGLGL